MEMTLALLRDEQWPRHILAVSPGLDRAIQDFGKVVVLSMGAA